MSFKLLSLLVFSILALGNGSSLQNSIDVPKLQAILEQNLKSDDISSVYYALRGLTLLKAKIPNICDKIKNAKYEEDNVEMVFYLTNAAALSGCQNSLKPTVMRPASAALDHPDAPLSDLYYAIYTLKAIGKGQVFDKEDGLKNIIQLLKKDDSPANYAYVFMLCEHMGCASWTTSHTENVLLAADESDSKALHFEGGLPVTANLLSSIVRSYKSLNKATPLSEAQRLKFAEYLLSRRSVTTAKGAALLLEAAYAIADDLPTPVVVALKGKKYITPDADSIEVAITDLIGRPYPNLKTEEVIAQSGTRLADDVVVLSKQALTKKDATTFVLNLSKLRSQYGMYKIAISAGSKSANINVAVLGDISVSSVEIGVGDVDGTTSPKTTTVTYPNKLSEKLNADHLQKITLKFTIHDKANKPVAVQQAFVHIGSLRSDEETIFVAEPDTKLTYKVELNVGGMSKHLSAGGEYSLRLVVGDSAAAAPRLWHLADLLLNFQDSNALGAPGAVTGAKSARGPLPEIAHQFRVAEARPSRALSDVFAFACAAPLALLLVLWSRLGLNCRNLPLSPAVPLFHAALGGSLALYGVLWLRLTMFETFRYLLPLAALAFLSGHRLLRRLVQDKQKQ